MRLPHPPIDQGFVMSVARGFSLAQGDPEGSRYMLMVNDKGEGKMKSVTNHVNKKKYLTGVRKVCNIIFFTSIILASTG